MNAKARIAEINALIAQLKKEKASLNPYANLKELSNKFFGEEWSESYICSHCPSFERKDQKGWDLWSEALGRVEVKSSRLPCAKVTFNQCHPYDCDYFLFIEYDTEEVCEHIFLVPSKDFFLSNNSPQHTRNDRELAECFTLNGTGQKSVQLLENNRVDGWEQLERLASGKEKRNG